MKTTTHKRNWLFLLATILCVFVILFAIPASAHAANGITTLKAGKTYKYALTGATKHSIKYTVSSDAYGENYKVNIYINGKLKKTVSADYGIGSSVKLLQINNKTKLIYVEIYAENDYTQAQKVYRYSGGKLVLSGDLVKLSSKLGSFIPASSGSNKLNVNLWSQTVSIGCYSSNTHLKYSKGALKRSTSTVKVKFYEDKKIKSGEPSGWKNNWGTACRSFTAYTTAGGSKVSFKVKKKDRLQVLYAKLYKGKLYYQVKNANGKKGWIKNYDSWKWNEKTDMHKCQYFYEAAYAG